MRTWLKLMPVLALTLGLAAPAVATDEDPCHDEDGTPLVEEHQAWIKDPEGLKAGNAAALGMSDLPSWDDEPPTGSLADGAGAGYVASGVPFLAAGWEDGWDEEYSVTVNGVFEGCLDNLAVSFYFNYPVWPLPSTNHSIAVRLFVDGEEITRSPLVQAIVFQNLLSAEPVGGARFAFAGLLDALGAVGVDPSGSHEITLQWQPRASSPVTVVFATAYLWDAVEVPANVVFNAESLDGFRIVE